MVYRTDDGYIGHEWSRDQFIVRRKDGKNKGFKFSLDNAFDQAVKWLSENTAAPEEIQSPAPKEPPIASPPTSVPHDGGHVAELQRDLLAVADLLEEDGKYQGLMATLIAAAAYRIKVTLVLVDHICEDILSKHAPALLERTGGYEGRHEIFLAPCMTSACDAAFTTRLPVNDAELLLCNHFTPLVRIEKNNSKVHVPHPPCNGIECGGCGFPCIAPMTQAVALLGFLPWPVPGDGDCLLHALLWSMGRQSLGDIGKHARHSMRKHLAAFVRSNAQDMELQRAAISFGEHHLAEELVCNIMRFFLRYILAVIGTKLVQSWFIYIYIYIYTYIYIYEFDDSATNCRSNHM